MDSPHGLKVRAGEWDTKTTEERLPYQERAVSKIVAHPSRIERTLAYDVVSIINHRDHFLLFLLLIILHRIKSARIFF